MNERLTEMYRSCRPKEALASQDEFKSANVLIGSDLDKFIVLMIKECANFTDHPEELYKHFGVENE